MALTMNSPVPPTKLLVTPTLYVVITISLRESAPPPQSDSEGLYARCSLTVFLLFHGYGSSALQVLHKSENVPSLSSALGCCSQETWMRARGLQVVRAMFKGE